MEEKESTWNMAKAYLQRMDFLLQKMNHYALIEDNYKWAKECMALFREISPKLGDKKLTHHKGRFNAVILLMNECKNDCQDKRVADYSRMFPLLSTWDMELRRSMEDLKLISPSSDDPGSALGGR